MTKNILVTGGAGYIGSHMVVSLVEAGYNPIIFDNFSNSKPTVLNRIEKITGKRPLLIEGDIRSESDLDKVFTEYKIDSVINFAGKKAVGESESDPLLYFSYNVEGTIVLLRVMKNTESRNSSSPPRPLSTAIPATMSSTKQLLLPQSIITV